MATAIQECVNEPPNRPIPQYGYQCMPGDEKLFEVCAGHKAWIDRTPKPEAGCMFSAAWLTVEPRCGI